MSRKKEEVRELLNRIRISDDQAAFKELFERYHSWLYTVAYNIINSNEDAEEILEDAFVKVWEIREKYDEIANIETYLYTIVKNKCYDRYKQIGKIKSVELNEELVNLEFIESPEETMMYKELDEKIKTSVSKLPPKCREIYLLIRESGASYKNAAESLSISQKTVESQMRIAIKRIAEDINDYLSSKDVEDRNTFLSLSLFLLA